MDTFARLEALDARVRRAKRADAARAHRRDNRYMDVVPYDETLAWVPGPEGPQYLNASYVEPSARVRDDLRSAPFELGTLAQRPRHYIAAQAPMAHTLERFLALALALANASPHRAVNIVMLTDPREGAREKSLDYVPLLREMWGPPLEKREGALETRVWHRQGVEVRHVYLRGWRDHGPPPEDALGDPLKRLSAMLGLGETLVHCSAGVGRTGTFMALDYVLKEGLGAHCLEGVVGSLRCARMWMVQSVGQWRYLTATLEASS